MEQFGANQMCDTIAINAYLPGAQLIINRATESVNTAREVLHFIWGGADVGRTSCTVSLVSLGTGRMVIASAETSAARSLLILSPPPEDPDDPHNSSDSSSSPATFSVIGASSAIGGNLELPPSPSNTIFSDTLDIPGA